jgi:glycosyltransferase involved in cell wall biosynthesis
MRVLSVLSDDRVGGPHVRSLDVANALRARGLETSFLVPDGDGDFPDAVRAAGFDVATARFRRLRGPQRPRENVRFLVGFREGAGRVAEAAETAGADLVHVNVATNFQAAAGAAWSDAPFMWHFNDTLTPAPVRQAAALAARRYADRVAVAADTVGDYYFPGRGVNTETLYAPVDVARFDPDTVAGEWPDGFLGRETAPKAPVVGTVANLAPVKGVEHFLRAVARVRDEHGVVVAPVVGKRLDSRAGYARRLESLVADLDLEDTVYFCGYRDDIPEVLSTFDAFVLPSIAEACPVVVLEAMAMARLVVATDVGGVTEQLTDGEHGFVVPPGDPEAIADRVLAVLDDPMRAESLGRAARERVVQRFSVEAIADRTQAVYRATFE